ncbi:hypothetical protein J7439_14940 [Salinisphaera sp. G21_0]|nr:hypothetical protein [Salinisphaera sp. G21_0]
MEFGVTARVIDYLGLPGDQVQDAKPAAVSLLRVRSTDNLRGGGETCKNYFENKVYEQAGSKVSEGSTPDKYASKQDERCCVVYKLASSWSYLLKYMSQCNEVMPAPSSISGLDLPDMMHPFDLREPALDSIAELKTRLSQLKGCWQKLNQWLLASPARLFVKKEDHTHHVMLRVDSQFIPGTLDLQELVTGGKTGGDRRAKATESARWLVPEKVWSFSGKDPLADVAGPGSQSDYGNKPFVNIERPAACSSTGNTKYSVALKPADYHLYQPVMKKLMTDICGRNLKKLSSLQDRVHFFRDDSHVEPLTTDEKKLLKEFAEVLETSRIWWITESPSVRSIFDQIFLAEKHKSPLTKGMMSVVTKFKSHVNLVRSLSSNKIFDKRQKEFLSVRQTSLGERDTGLKTSELPKITFTPGSPERKPKV